MTTAEIESMRWSRFAVFPLLCMVVLLSACTRATTQHLNAGPPCEAGQVDLNTATREQLLALPEIGEVMADRILDYRKKSGPFLKAADVIVIPGMGEKRFRKIEPLICAGPSPRLPANES